MEFMEKYGSMKLCMDSYDFVWISMGLYGY